MINPVSYYDNYSNYYNIGFYNTNHTTAAVGKISDVTPINDNEKLSVVKTEKEGECQTCKNRKYMDVSGENNVSFKSPAHISPEASFGMVASHESEHVANAVSKGNKPGAKLVSASVRYKMAVCPECGKPYVAGGATTTVIKYDDSNPYEANRKSAESSLLKGMYVDLVA